MKASIDAVRVAGTPEGPVYFAVLAVEEESEILPISIGFMEAASIARGLDAEDIGRPLTHDLLLDVMEELGGRIDRVEVTELREATYIADLHLETPRGQAVVDARPSDSLALAARTNVPIDVDAEVFEEGRRPPDEFEDLQDLREVTRLS